MSTTSKTLRVRMSSSQFEALEAEAERTGQSVSEYVRKALESFPSLREYSRGLFEELQSERRITRVLTEAHNGPTIKPASE